MRKRKTLILLFILVLILFFSFGFYSAKKDFKGKYMLENLSIFLKKYSFKLSNKFSRSKEKYKSPLSEIFITLGGNINYTTKSPLDEGFLYGINGLNEISQILSNDTISLSSMVFEENINNYQSASILFKYLKDQSIDLLNFSNIENQGFVKIKESLESNGTNYLFNNYNWGIQSNGNKLKFITFASLNYTYEFIDKLSKDISTSKKNNDAIIVIFNTKNFSRDIDIEKILKYSIDIGSDVVILNNYESNSIEKYKNGFIIKSNNTIFSNIKSSDINLNENYLYQLSFVFSDKSLVSIGIKAFPYKLSDNKGIFYPSLLGGDEKKKALDKLSYNNFKISDKFNFIQLK